MTEGGTQPDMNKKMSCPLCGQSESQIFFEISNVPVLCNVLYEDEAAAKKAAIGGIELHVCDTCGLIYNRAFDTGLVEYVSGYENSLHHSEKFSEFAESLASRLVREHQLEGSTVVEIGCGDATFLQLLLKKGVGSGIGFEPSALNLNQQISQEGLQIIPEQFHQTHMPSHVDALICRHVLEHVSEPVRFLKSIRETISTHDTICYFEVPNAEWIMNAVSVYDVIYEHVTYWSKDTLINLFQHCGFEPVSVTSDFDDQYLMLEARPGNLQPLQLPANLNEVKHITRDFAGQATAIINKWKTYVEELALADKKLSIWGAGSKGISFLNIIPGVNGVAQNLVDMNPAKQGKFVAGCGLPVIAPEKLRKRVPEAVLIMNPVYKSEIRNMLVDINLKTEVEVILAID